MDIKVPSVGESVYEALIARWLKKSGDRVEKDEPLCEIETDKVTIEVAAEVAGVLTILVPEVETVKIGAVIGTIEAAGAEAPAAGSAPQPAAGTPAAAARKEPAPPVREPKPETPPVREPGDKPEPVREPPTKTPAEKVAAEQPSEQAPPMSPSGRKLAREMGVDARDLRGTGRGGRVTREDLLKAPDAVAGAPAAEAAAPEPPEAAELHAETAEAAEGAPRGQARAVARDAEASVREAAPAKAAETEGRITRKPMSPIRKRIAERLVAARQQTAMLTTFNEADMSQVQTLRKKHGEFFMKRHNVKLGLMSLFVRACCQALKEYPEVNASIEGTDIVYHNYCDIGIAVGGEKGLVVPVLRDAESLTLAGIEQRIAEFSDKIRTNKLAIADLEGGTFTVSNGGIYGSMLSTPILNPPQSGVLGMHAIQDRPVVRDGQIVIRPMMYLALSYDHRIVDGKGAVGFLKLVKQYIEEPEEMFLES